MLGGGAAEPCFNFSPGVLRTIPYMKGTRAQGPYLSRLLGSNSILLRDLEFLGMFPTGSSNKKLAWF